MQKYIYTVIHAILSGHYKGRTFHRGGKKKRVREEEKKTTLTLNSLLSPNIYIIGSLLYYTFSYTNFVCISLFLLAPSSTHCSAFACKLPMWNFYKNIYNKSPTTCVCHYIKSLPMHISGKFAAPIQFLQLFCLNTCVIK